MNKKTRALSLILSVVMLGGIMAVSGVSASAETEPTTSPVTTAPQTTNAPQTTTAAPTTTAKSTAKTPAPAKKTTVKKKKSNKPNPTEIKLLVPQKNGFKIKWKKVKKIKGYHLQWSVTKKFKKAKKYTKKVYLKSKVISGNIVRLSAKKKYYFRIRTYKMNGKKKVFSKWSKVICKKTL
ncbi:MAG: hypothetical protein VZR54_05050 [Ruminococcus sp.]|nr:hypothetical protein [Ruminococcus sp.]